MELRPSGSNARIHEPGPQPSSAAAGAHPLADDPMSSLAGLRALFAGSASFAGDKARTHFEELASALGLIMSEHRGMADELLCVYEQLGVVFEVTRKLTAVRSEDEVLGLFLESLKRSFADREVFVARLRQSGGWVCAAQAEPLDQRLCTALEKVCRGPRARTQVVNLAASRLLGTPKPEQVLIGPVYSGESLVCALVILQNNQKSEAQFRASDMSLVESLAIFCGDLIRNHRLVREMREMSIAMVRSLVSAVDQKDQYTCGHSLRVGYYASMLGRLLRLPDIQLQMLQWSALLHDVGKIGIRDDVLNKQGKLTPEEFRHIQEHPGKSHRVVQQVPQLADALDGILYHHEHYDGSGYPAGLKGENIPLQARIIQIADVFDALTSSRSYRPAYGWEEALSILQAEAGKTVDPHLQKIFDAGMRQTLESDSQAWQRVTEQANHFASAFESEEGNKR